MDLEVRHLRYFVAVAEELSFTKAAQRLHVAQPPLSRAVKSLEKQLGVSLLARTTRRVELTAAGSLLLDDAREIIESFDSALARAAQAGRAENRSLRIGFRPAASLPMLEPIVREFTKHHPETKTEATRIEWTDQVSCLLAGRVDVAFVLYPLEHHQVDVIPLLAAPRAVAMPNDHPLSERTSLSIDDLQSYPLAVPSGAPSDWQRFWTAAGRQVDPLVPEPPHVSNADESLAVVLSGGALVLAISTVMTYYRDTSLAIVPVHDLSPGVIGLAYRKGSEHPGIEAFTNVAIEVAEDIALNIGEESGTRVAGPAAVATADLEKPLTSQLAGDATA